MKAAEIGPGQYTRNSSAVGSEAYVGAQSESRRLTMYQIVPVSVLRRRSLIEPRLTYKDR